MFDHIEEFIFFCIQLLAYITVKHSQTTASNNLMGRFTLTAALSDTQRENMAFCIKRLPTHALGRRNQYSSKAFKIHSII